MRARRSTTASSLSSSVNADFAAWPKRLEPMLGWLAALGSSGVVAEALAARQPLDVAAFVGRDDAIVAGRRCSQRVRGSCGRDCSKGSTCEGISPDAVQSIATRVRLPRRRGRRVRCCRVSLGERRPRHAGQPSLARWYSARSGQAVRSYPFTVLVRASDGSGDLRATLNGHSIGSQFGPAQRGVRGLEVSICQGLKQGPNAPGTGEAEQ